MTTPDEIVASNGEPLTLSRVTDFSVGPDGTENVTRELVQIQGIVSNPSEEMQQALSGRLSEGAITVTVKSDLDIEDDRDGGRDRIIRPAIDSYDGETIYSVEQVTRDTHALAGISKTTVVCDLRGNRSTLFESDADTYI